MNIKSILALLVMLSISGFVGDTNAQAKATELNQSKTERLLKEIKADYSPFQGKGTFIVRYTGKVQKNIDVILVETDGAILLLPDVAAGNEINLTPVIANKLLESNMQFDYIKVGISELRSIRVQSEQNLRVIDGEVLGELLDQIAAGADEVARILAPVRKKPGTAKKKL